MFTGEDFLLNAVDGAEHGIDVAHAFEALDARGDRKDVVLLSGFHEERRGAISPATSYISAQLRIPGT